MLNILRASALVLAAAICLGAESYDVQWPKLESAFSAFLQEPTAARAEAMVELLPAGKRASHHFESYDSEVSTRIYERTGEVDKLVASGDRDAYRVAFALTEISDGEWSTWLGAIIGGGVARFPDTYLQEISKRHANRRNPCIEAVQFHWDFEGEHVAVLKARLAAIRSVDDPALIGPKRCAVALIEEYLNKPPLK